MNPLRIDPTRTGLLQRRLTAELGRLLSSLQAECVRQVLDPTLLTVNAWWGSPDDKVHQFLAWLRERADSLVVKPAKAVLSRLLGRGVQAGATRGVQQARRARPLPPPAVQVAVATALGGKTPKERVALLTARSLVHLRGLTEDVAKGVGALLVDGFEKGRNPKTVAKDIVKQFGLTKYRAETIARTEMIRAHAEGQLIAFEAMGVTSVGVLAEWKTAGDGKVCPECHRMEGKRLILEQARGRIPMHPRCRCAWVPYVPLPTAQRSTA